MKILVLGNRMDVVPVLQCDGHIMEDKVTPEFAKDFDFLISYGYRHILKRDILDLFPDKAINLHISMLPWNKGADPNYWSFVDDTPKGVTIHYMDEGLDTGDIIAQRVVEMSRDETLSTSYEKLHAAMLMLLHEQLPSILDGTCSRTKQIGKGSYHKSADKDGMDIDYNKVLAI